MPVVFFGVGMSDEMRAELADRVRAIREAESEELTDLEELDD